jgi:1-acyl-sn-glycerol-3-phosphate acyltransferase
MSGPTLHASRTDAWMSHVVYESVYAGAAVAMTLGWSLRSHGRHNIPKAGPALLIANHQSFIDPLLVGLGTRRHLCFLARKTLFKHPLFTWLIRMLNAVPIDQEGVGKDGIKTIVEQLQLGQAVVIFPEGHRTPHGAMLPLMPGVLLLIKRTQAPIVPVGIAGAYDAWPSWRKYPILAPLFLPNCRRRIAVSIGVPTDASRIAQLPRAQALRELSQLIDTEQRRAELLRRGARS